MQRGAQHTVGCAGGGVCRAARRRTARHGMEHHHLAQSPGLGLQPRPRACRTRRARAHMATGVCPAATDTLLFLRGGARTPLAAEWRRG